jgi:hypothetical protein
MSNFTPQLNASLFPSQPAWSGPASASPSSTQHWTLLPSPNFQGICSIFAVYPVSLTPRIVLGT